MKFVNLTPHIVSLQHENGDVQNIPISGECRVTIVDTVVGSHAGIPIVVATYGELIGLPEPVEGTLYILSLLAAQAAAAIGRFDVVSPGKLLRYPKDHPTLPGQPYACTTLTRQA